MKRTAAAILTILGFLASTCAMATLNASGTLAYTGGPSTYHYSISLKNTGTVAIGVFWYSWTPDGKNYMPVTPTNIAAPTGWMVDFVSNSSASDGFGIHFSTTGSLAAGATISGFTFDSTATPSQMLGNSPKYPTVPTGTSYVFDTTQANSTPFVVAGASSPQVSNFGLQKSAIVGGNPVTGTVTISSAAGASGFTVNLSSSNSAAASVPSTVTVASGVTTASVPITTHGVDSATTVSLTASGGGGSKIASLSVQPASLLTVSAAPSVIGGLSGSGSINLNGQASPSGKTATLASDNAALKVPASTKVAAGKTSATFTETTTPVNADTAVHVTATLNGVSKVGTTTVLTADLSNLVVSGHIYGGMNGSLLIDLNGKAGSAGTTVNLSSSNPAVASVPATGHVGAGHGSGSAIITTTGVSASTSVTFTGSLGGITKQATTSIIPAALAAVTASPLTVVGGDTAKGTVSLFGKTVNAYGITLSSSDISALTVPATVSIAAGTGAVSFVVTTQKVNSPRIVTLTAKHLALSRTVQVTVTTVPIPKSVGFSFSTVKGGSSVTCTVTLSGPAPKAGAVVALSSDTAEAPVPASITISGGANSAQFTIKTGTVSAQKTAHIKATFNTVSATGLLTITP